MVGVGDAARHIAKAERRLGFAGLINQGIKGGGLRVGIARGLSASTVSPAEQGKVTSFDLGLLDVPNRSGFRIMAREVTLGMFRRFMKETRGTPKEYIFERPNADKLVNILNGQTNSSAPVNYSDREEDSSFRLAENF